MTTTVHGTPQPPGSRQCPRRLKDAITAIEAELRQRSSAELGARIEAARAIWPHDLKLLLLEGEWHEVSGRLAEAEICFCEARRTHPENPWAPVRIFNLLVKSGRASEARTIFADDIWRTELPEATRSGLLSRVTAITTDLEARREYLERLLDGRPEDRFVYLKLAALKFRQRDRAAAEQAFEAAQRLGPLPVESELLQVELLLALARFDEAFARAKDLVARHPGRLDFVRRAIQTGYLANRIHEAERLLRGALARSPGDWLLLFRFNRALCAGETDRSLFRLIEQHEPAAGDDYRWLFQFAIACLRQQQTARAVTLLDRSLPESPVAHLAAPLRAALENRPGSGWTNPRGISNDPEADVQIVPVRGAQGTVVVLAGVQGGLGYLPFSHVDSLLADHPVNAVYLRDLNNRGFTAGVRRFGPDPAGTTAGLQQIRSSLGGVPVVTMGSSLGGIAAIRIAAQMQAEAAISFAGPIHLGANSLHESEGPSRPAGTRGSVSASLIHDDLSLVELVRNTPETQVYQCYGADNEPDVRSAGLLRGVPNAVLIPLPGCADHFVVEHMLAGCGFADLLMRAVETGAP